MKLPLIDPRIHHVGVSKLRSFSATKLRSLSDELYVIRDGQEPLYVLLSWELFQSMATAIRSGASGERAADPSTR